MVGGRSALMGKPRSILIASTLIAHPMFRALLHRASAALPARCAVCHAWPAQPVCESCVNRYAQPRPRCQTCALPVAQDVSHCGTCIATPPPLDLCLAAVPYDYPWNALIARYKFAAHPGWADALALLMRSAPWVEPALEQADLLIPMPLTGHRLRERGFNQALELARRLAPAKTEASLLLRVRDAPAQSTLDRAERQRNVKGAFAIPNAGRAEIDGRRIVLIDDVMTSGASLHAAAHALREAGARHITGLVFARTE